MNRSTKLNSMVVVALTLALYRPANASLIVTPLPPQPAQVVEGDPGHLDFQITNDSKTNNVVLTQVPSLLSFKLTGGKPDNSDKPLLQDPQSGMAAGDTLGPGKSFFYRFPFTTPDPTPDPVNPETDGDFGQWDIVLKDSTKNAGLVMGNEVAKDGTLTAVQGQIPGGTIIVLDKGVPPFNTPEPATLSMFAIGGLLIGAGCWLKQDRASN